MTDISAANDSQRIAVLGGTFDPVHCAHVNVANTVYQSLALDALYMIPCWQSPHRELPTASAQHRLTMLNLALADQASLTADARELEKQGPSYSVDTMRALRDEHPQAQLFLIMGGDAFQHFLKWHCWQEILTLTHLVVVKRPGYSLLDDCADKALATLVKERLIEGAPMTLAGSILSVAVEPSSVSATEIRSLLLKQQSADNYLPTAVLQYIQQHGLYQ